MGNKLVSYNISYNIEQPIYIHSQVEISYNLPCVTNSVITHSCNLLDLQQKC